MNRKAPLIFAAVCSIIAIMVGSIGSIQDVAPFFGSNEKITGEFAASESLSDAKNTGKSKRFRERKQSGKSLEDLAAISGDLARLETELAAIDPDELWLLMESLATKAKLEGSGLGGRYDSLLARILEWKCQQDMESALDWVLTMKNVQQKNDLLRVALNLATEQSVEAGLAFYERLRFELGQQPSASYLLLGKCTKLDAASFERYCRCAVYENPNTTGWKMDFAENFDFATALNKLADIQASVAKGQGFTALPYNILSEWAKRDPQAAFEWMLMGKYVIMNHGIDDFIEGYKEVASDAEVGTLIADIYQRSNDYTDAFRAMRAGSNSSIIGAFLEAAPASRSPEQHLAELLRVSMKYNDYQADYLRNNFLTKLAYQQRVDLFMNDVALKPADPKIAKKLRENLSELGHPPEEIDKMIVRISDASNQR